MICCHATRWTLTPWSPTVTRDFPDILFTKLAIFRSAYRSRYSKYPLRTYHDAGWEVSYPYKLTCWELVTNVCLLAVFFWNYCWLEKDTARPLPGSLWHFVRKFAGTKTCVLLVFLTHRSPCLVNVDHLWRGNAINAKTCLLMGIHSAWHLYLGNLFAPLLRHCQL